MSGSGIDTALLDPSRRPQDDLFGHVNARWLADNPIPADRGRYGSFDRLREQAEADVRDIIEEMAAGENPEGSPGQQVGDLFASFLDEETADARGLEPIADLLDRVAAVGTTGELLELLGELGREGVPGLVQPFISADDKDPGRYVVYLEQAGLGLPDESYYRDPSHTETKTAYAAHVGRMMAFAGLPTTAAAEALAVEERLASAHWDNVSCRDAVKTYTLVDGDGLAALTPGVDWAAYLRGLGAGEGTFAATVVRQPSYVSAMASALAELPLGAWRSWLSWHVLHAFAPYLTSAIVAENFDFYGRTLSGVQEQRARWKRGVALVEECLGEAVGRLYVERHYPPVAAERMAELVANLIEAFRRRFADLPWMGEETRAAAIAKLEGFTPKIGHPTKWRDYSALRVVADDLVGNVRRAAAVETDRQLAKLGTPVDREEWLMYPQTVNAYYHPTMNEIVFPAAILQPPFFDAEADDAVNYGGIGAVIGHEIGHAFDDQGSQFDATGNLRNWWNDDDRTAFDALAQRLIAQFDTLETRDAAGTKVNGALTVGENIGDLGGLAIGLAAYRIAHGGAAPVLDGLTGDQRFFIGWAQVWRGAARPEEALRLLTIDPHSPVDVRANAVRNIDAFHDAFDVQPGDGMWLAPGERVRIF